MSNLRLAALLHDVGKEYCFNKFGNFHGHEKCSEVEVRIILNRLRYPKDVIEQVCRLCALHMYDLRCDARESKVRRFIVDNLAVFDKLLSVKQADYSGCRDDLFRSPRRRQIQGDLRGHGARKRNR